jgi:predicted nucleic acid-binding protein
MIFVDTSVFYARLARQDRHQAAADAFFQEGLAAMIPVTEEDHRAARAIIDNSRDKDFSLCDALSFAVMERLKITRAASFDKHFRQYGKFTVLP